MGAISVKDQEIASHLSDTGNAARFAHNHSFDLIADLEARYPEYQSIPDGEIANTSLYHVPFDEIICNVDRCLVGTKYGKAWATCSLLRYSAQEVLNYHPDKQAWQKLRAGLKESSSGDDEAVNALEEFCSSFSFSIPTVGKKQRVYKFRVPAGLNATTHAIADSLGIDWNTLSQVMVIDALKSQPNVRNRDQLNSISTHSIESFDCGRDCW